MGGRPNYGPTAQERTKRLLEALLAYANDELEGSERLQIEANWQTENKLVVRTKVRFLEQLTAKYQKDGKLDTEQIKEALKRLKDWLEILEDNRTKTQGSEDWHFTLTLWSKDKQENLKRFEFEWESRKAKKSNSTNRKVRPNSLENPSKLRGGIDWQQVCHAMLEAQNQGRLTTNPLTTGDGVAFKLDEIYVPLGLVERKQRDRRSGDVSPEQGSQLYEPEIQDEIIQTFQQDQFFEQVLRPRRSRRIAIIGEPGAGKTTLLQKIAAWVLDNTEDVPIWISLADLQGKSLEQYLLSDWLKASTRKVRVTETMQEALGELFNSKRVWLLLDAVDEMAVGTQSLAPLQWIANQLTGWVSDARVVLTCRLNVWDAGKNALEAFDTYRNLDFSYGDAQTPDQVRQFIRRWFKDNSILAERLRTELDQPGKERIKDAVKNPLRLALLYRSWALAQGRLPNTKAGLYQQFTEALYEWKQDRFPTSSTKRQELNKALGELALRAIASSKTKFRLRHRLVSSVLGKPDEDVFGLALQLGWLNQVGVAAESENRGEKVYAFYHPTFQEYFAAQAIDDWHYFLNHTLHNPDIGTYRIFEPQWKEVILLWLGREDVPQEQKELFIRALVTFEDGCGDANSYGLRAYLLATVGLAELESPDRVIEIMVQTPRRSGSHWRSDIFMHGTQTLHKFFLLLERTAQGRVRETEYGRAIETIISVLHTSNNARTHHQCLVALERVGIGNQDAINAVVKLLQTCQDDWTQHQCVQILREIGVGNRDAISAVVELLQGSQNRETQYQYLMTLREIGVGNQDAINALVKLLQTRQDDWTIDQCLTTLGIIDVGNQEAINVLAELLQTRQDDWIIAHYTHYTTRADNPNTTCTLNKMHDSQDKKIYREIIESLDTTDFSSSEVINILLEQLHSDQDARNWLVNQLDDVNSISQLDTIKVLNELLCNSQNSRTRWKIADILGQIDPGNLDALNALINLICNNDHRSEAVWSLKKTLQDNLFPLAISGLKDSLEDRDERCYEIIWHCAQKMTYSDFYQAWHNLPAVNPITQNLNLVELPQNLTTAIANDLVLSQAIHLICIDGSKFIDSDNPAAEIYIEMVEQGCPERQQGEPATMQALKIYWKRLKSDKRVVLVFYENPTGYKLQGFSHSFVTALSKFDGAICVVTSPPVSLLQGEESKIISPSSLQGEGVGGWGSLQCFSSSQPQLVEDILGWLRAIR